VPGDGRTLSQLARLDPVVPVSIFRF
jgi:hypothetical protein